MELTFPFCPINKSNRMLLTGGRLIRSRAARDFEEQVRSVASAALIEEGWDPQIHIPQGKKLPIVGHPYFTSAPLCVEVVLFRPGKRGIDLDGIKGLLDGINLSGVWQDDREISELHIRREKGDPSTKVTIHYAMGGTRRRYWMPTVMPRKEWWDARKKEREVERRQTAQERLDEEVIIAVFCARCGIGIGKHTARHYAFYWPKQKAGKEVVRFCCEQCAKALGLEPWRQLNGVGEVAETATLLRRALELKGKDHRDY